MTILKSLSDRDGFIFEVIRIIVNNNKDIQLAGIQYKLLECGVYVKKTLLEEAIKTMIEKKLLTPATPVKKVEKPKIITQL